MYSRAFLTLWGSVAARTRSFPLPAEWPSLREVIGLPLREHPPGSRVAHTYGETRAALAGLENDAGGILMSRAVNRRIVLEEHRILAFCTVFLEARISICGGNVVADILTRNSVGSTPVRRLQSSFGLKQIALTPLPSRCFVPFEVLGVGAFISSCVSTRILLLTSNLCVHYSLGYSTSCNMTVSGQRFRNKTFEREQKRRD